MNTRLVNSAAGVIQAAQAKDRTSAGIALALDSAQLLMSPETAAELERFRALELGDPDGRVSAACGKADHPTWLRAQSDVRTCPWCRVAELEAERHTTNEALSNVAVALRERETSPFTVFRAAHDSIVMGLYSTAAEARKHCETEMRREYHESTKVSLWWKEDEDTVDQPDDGEQELYVHATPAGMPRGRTWNSGYVVTPLEIASEYDEAADE